MQSLLQTYLCSDFWLVFPLVDGVLFEETVRRAYAPQSTLQPLEHISAKACVFAFLSIASTHFPDSEAAEYVDPDVTAKEAQMLLSDFLEDTSITTLQTVFMLVCEGSSLLSFNPTVTDRHGRSCYTRLSAVACKPGPCITPLPAVQSLH